MLEHIVARSGMYWGDSDNHFHSFIAFISGLETGLNISSEVRDEMEQIIPNDFHQFVTECFGFKYPFGGHGYCSLIEKYTNSGDEALKLFLDLRRQYDSRKNNGE